jgi:hypothetical protein
LLGAIEGQPEQLKPFFQNLDIKSQGAGQATLLQTKHMAEKQHLSGDSMLLKGKVPAGQRQQEYVQKTEGKSGMGGFRPAQADS